MSRCARGMPNWQIASQKRRGGGRAQPALPPKGEEKRRMCVLQFRSGSSRQEDTHPNQLQIHTVCELIAEGEYLQYAFSINLCAL